MWHRRVSFSHSCTSTSAAATDPMQQQHYNMDPALMMLTPMYTSLPPASHATATTTTTTTATSDGMLSLAAHDHWGADLDFSGALLSAETSHPSSNNMYDLDILHLEETTAAHGANGVMWQELDMVGAGCTPFVALQHMPPTMHQSGSMTQHHQHPHQHHHQNLLGSPWLAPPMSAPHHSMPQLHPPPPPPLVQHEAPPPVQTPPKKRRSRAASDDDDDDHIGLVPSATAGKPRRKINVTKEWLEANGFFDMRARDAALKLGIGVTTLKRYCRSDLNLDRWPWRKRVGASKAPSGRARPGGAPVPRRSRRVGGDGTLEDVDNAVHDDGVHDAVHDAADYSSHEEEETVALDASSQQAAVSGTTGGTTGEADTMSPVVPPPDPSLTTTALMCC